MKLQRYFSVILLTLALTGSQLNLVKADSALRLFESQFNIWNNGKKPKPLSSQNPWKPYLNRSFDEGLSQQDKKRYLSFQESSDCYSVIQLDLLGFLRLYPFLTPAFEREDIRDYFERTLVYEYSKGAQRCFAKETLNKVITFTIKNNNYFPKITLPVKNKNIIRSLDYRKTIPEKRIANAFMLLYMQAFCEGHISSIMDIDMYQKNGYILLSMVD